MKQLFVGYDIAKELKEKGFNEPCLAYADARDKELIMWDHIFDINNCSNKMFNSIEIAIPLYQQVIDWLRVEKGVFIEIDLYKNLFNIYFKDVETDNMEWQSPFCPPIYGIDDYYEAVNKAIVRVLELI